ncbi:hypothetical protein AV530_005856 [Patagioenas fasciata monilis]|uniref:Uncharacterized protein n=1 Tax=Patagioenas fasciata monilis TaxID=372326 RepID=A0A1V4JN38_PATFA|nr:hypothetical protein AV530_005856 [Patagioenas fasciata monilis]
MEKVGRKEADETLSPSTLSTEMFFNIQTCILSKKWCLLFGRSGADNVQYPIFGFVSRSPQSLNLLLER